MMHFSEFSTATMHSPMDGVRLYVPRSTLQDFVREEYGSRDVYLVAIIHALATSIQKEVHVSRRKCANASHSRQETGTVSRYILGFNPR
jgi:hypothetical protein